MSSGAWGRPFFFAACLLLLTLAAYSNSFSSGFPLDNSQAILSDVRIREASAENLDSILHHTYWWPYDESGLYRPVTTLSYLFNYAILGNEGRPAGYHWINFLLHYGNALLVWVLCARLTRDSRTALFVAAIWAVHPILTESVTNIVGRADLLAGFSVLAGLLAAIQSADSKGWKRALWLAAVAAAAAIGAFSKESAIVLPAVIALWAIAMRRPLRSFLAPCAAAVLPAVLMLYQRAAVLAWSLPAHIPFTDNPIAGAAFWTGRLTALQVIVRYLLLLLWPARLSADYSYAQIPLARASAGDWLLCLPAVAVAAGIAVLWRYHRAGFFLAAFAALTFVPAANLLFPIGTIMAERLMYLPAIGFVGCAVLGVEAACRRLRVPAAAVVALVAAACAARTWARNPDWNDDLSMANALVRTVPRSFKAHRLLAWQLFQSDPAHSNIDRVIEEAEKSLAILRPLPDSENDAATWRMAGEFYYVKGAYQNAAQSLLRSGAIMTAAQERAAASGASATAYAGSGDLYRLLSAVYLGLHDSGRAIEAGQQAVSADPKNPESYRAAARAYLAAQRADDAAVVLMAGHISTGDFGLRHEVLQLYRGGLDPKGCAIVAGPSGPALNPSCETVHRHLCAALLSLKSAAARDYGCPAE